MERDDPPIVRGFPPLPRDTRLRVENAELAPSPRLELTAEPLTRGGRWLVIAAALLFALLSVVIAAGAFGSVAGLDPAAGLLCGASCSLVMPVIGLGSVLALHRQTTRMWLRATPDRLEIDRVWADRHQPFTFDVEQGSGRRPAPGCHPTRLRGTFPLDGAGWLRLGDGPPITPPLRPQDLEWLCHALARTYAETHSPQFVEAIPLVVAVPPVPGRLVEHPRVRTLRDEPDRLVLSYNDWPTWMGRAWRSAVGAALLAGAALGLWFVIDADWPVQGEDRWLVYSALGGATAIGVFAAASGWRTVRIGITADWVTVRTGWGPLRTGRAVPVAWLSTLAAGGDREPGANELRTAWLVPHGAVGREGAQIAPPGWTRLTPAENDDHAFAFALTAKIADRLAEFGWRPHPPADWRFGWREAESPQRSGSNGNGGT